MAKGNTWLIITAVVLLFIVLLLSQRDDLTALSRTNRAHEGFQTKKEDVCTIVKKGKDDISTQLDQASALMTDANEQLAKIKSSLDDVSKLTTSFDC